MPERFDAGTKIEIQELDWRDVKNLPDEIRTIKPRACLKCNNEEDLEKRLFRVNVSIGNKLIENEINRLMKDRYGVSQYGIWSDSESTVLSASKCLKCGSEEIFEDY